MEDIFTKWSQFLNDPNVSDLTKSAILYYLYKEKQPLDSHIATYFETVDKIERIVDNLLKYQLPFMKHQEVTAQAILPEEEIKALAENEQLANLNKHFVNMSDVLRYAKIINNASNYLELVGSLQELYVLIYEGKKRAVDKAQQEVNILDDYARYKISRGGR